MPALWQSFTQGYDIIILYVHFFSCKETELRILLALCVDGVKTLHIWI